MKTLKVTGSNLLFVVVLLLLSCSNSSTNVLQGDEMVCEIKVVFFGFYDQLVKFSVNDNIIVNEVLSVADASNGLNQVKILRVSGNANFHLVSGNISSKQEVDFVCAYKQIYVNPVAEPYIFASASDLILLD
ncbi:MAG: hypothetical protein WBM36_01690 [Lysobacterales bacterium]